MSRDTQEEIKQSISLIRPLLDDEKLDDDQREALQKVVNYYAQNPNNKVSINAISYPQDLRTDEPKSRKIKINWYPLMTSTLLICLSSFMYGYASVQSSLVIDTTNHSVGSLNHKFKLTNFEKQSLIPASGLIGASIACILMLFYPSVRYGRKTILLLSNIPIVIGCLLCMFAVSPIMIIAGFVFEGFGYGISGIIAPVLLSEISPSSIRSVVTLFHQLFITFGILMTSVVTFYFIRIDNGFKWIISIVIIIPIFQLCFYKKIPESPRWLIVNNKSNKAKNIIYNYFKNKNNAKDEFEKISKYISNNLENVAMDNNLTQIKEMRDYFKPLLIGMTVDMFGQWTGCNFIFYQTQRVLHGVKGYEGYNVYYFVALLYLINFIATIICIICSFCGIKNKKMIYSGAMMMLISLLFLGIVDMYYDDNDNLIVLLNLIKLGIYIFGYAISLGAFVWIINCELFPLCHRIRGGSICLFVSWSTNTALAYNINSLLTILNSGSKIDHTSFGRLYFIFCIMVFCWIVFARKYIPETRNKSLESAVKEYNVAGGMVFAN